MIYGAGVHGWSYADSSKCGADDPIFGVFFVENAVDSMTTVTIPLRVFTCPGAECLKALVNEMLDGGIIIFAECHSSVH